MADASDESLFAYLIRYAEQVKVREYELGAYPGDGPTADQADAFTLSLRPLIQPREESFTPSEIWGIFKVAVDMEMLWAVPEGDPIGQLMKVGLHELQSRLGRLLDEYSPESAAERRNYLGLARFANAARREAMLQSNAAPPIKFLNNVSVALRTSLAWLLFSFGRALKRLAADSRK